MSENYAVRWNSGRVSFWHRNGAAPTGPIETIPVTSNTTFVFSTDDDNSDQAIRGFTSSQITIVGSGTTSKRIQFIDACLSRGDINLNITVRRNNQVIQSGKPIIRNDPPFRQINPRLVVVGVLLLLVAIAAYYVFNGYKFS